MTETDPLLRPPTGPCVVIDGKSLCHLDHDSTQLSFVRLEIAITQISEMLAPIAGGALRVWVDASLRPNLSARDQQRFDQAKASRRILEGPSGIELDPVFLEWAYKHRALVVSKDRFRTHIQRFPFLNQPGRTFAPAFYDDDQHWVFIEREAPKSRAPQTLSDAINQLARTMSPHPHRVNPADSDVGLKPRLGVRPPEETRPGPQPVTITTLANTLDRPIGHILQTARSLWPKLHWTPNTPIGPERARLLALTLERHNQSTEPHPGPIAGPTLATALLGQPLDRLLSIARHLWPKQEWTAGTPVTPEQVQRLASALGKSGVRRPPHSNPPTEPTPSTAPDTPPTGPQPVTITTLANTLNRPIDHILQAARALWPKLLWTPNTPIGPSREHILHQALHRPPYTNPPTGPASRDTASTVKEPSGRQAKQRPRRGTTRHHAEGSQLAGMAEEEEVSVAEVLLAATTLWPNEPWHPESMVVPQREQALREALRQSKATGPCWNRRTRRSILRIWGSKGGPGEPR